MSLNSNARADRIPTGVEFLDRILAGGQIPSGVHGLLGTFGSGKTTLATMIAVEAARREYETSGHRKWVYFAIDEERARIVERAISYGAQIPRDRACQIACSGMPGPAASQQSQTLTKWQALERRLHVIDLSLESSTGKRSPVKYLQERISQLMFPVAGITIDYAGLLIKRYIASRNLSEKRTSYELCSFVAGCRSELAYTYQCPVWVIHQLSTQANRKPPGVSQHHENAALCRSFGKHLDACASLGTVDKATGCVTIAVSKAPTAPEQRGLPPQLILSFHEDYAALTADTLHRINRMTYQIEPLKNRVQMDKATRDELKRLFGGLDMGLR